MDYRENGKTVLRLYLNKEQNVNTFEKYTYEIASIEIDSDLLIEKYNEILYEIVGLISENKKMSEVLQLLKNRKIIWDNPVYDNVKQLIVDQDNFTENPVEIEEGVHQCRHILQDGKICGSTRVYSYSKQVRSADEGMTTFCQCVACGSKWTCGG